MDLDQKIVSVVIHLGESYSTYSFSFCGDSIIYSPRHWSGSQGPNSHKNPTSVFTRLNEDGTHTLKAFGFEAEKLYAQKSEEEHKMCLFRGFGMSALVHSTDEPLMKDVTGKRRAKSIDIFAMILTVMTDQFYVFYNDLDASGRRTIDSDSINWTVVVPNTWNAYTTVTMRRAADKIGLKRTTIICGLQALAAYYKTENANAFPRATSMACKDLNISPGIKYMVVDFEADVLGLGIYEVIDGECVRELHLANNELCGGNKIGNIFEKLVLQFWSEEFVTHIKAKFASQWLLMMNIFSNIKLAHMYDPKCKDILVTTIPYAVCTEYRTMKREDILENSLYTPFGGRINSEGCVFLCLDAFYALYEDLVEDSIVALSTKIEKFNIDRTFIVCESSKSHALNWAMEKIDQITTTIIQEEPTIAITRGAFEFNKKPALIKARANGIDVYQKEELKESIIKMKETFKQLSLANNIEKQKKEQLMEHLNENHAREILLRNKEIAELKKDLSTQKLRHDTDKRVDQLNQKLTREQKERDIKIVKLTKEYEELSTQNTRAQQSICDLTEANHELSVLINILKRQAEGVTELKEQHKRERLVSNCQREELREHVDKLKQTNKKFTSTNTTEKQKTEDAISDLNENHLRAIRLSNCKIDELREQVNKLKETNIKLTLTNMTEKQKTEDAISDLNENHAREIRLRNTEIAKLEKEAEDTHIMLAQSCREADKRDAELKHQHAIDKKMSADDVLELKAEKRNMNQLNQRLVAKLESEKSEKDITISKLLNGNASLSTQIRKETQNVQRLTEENCELSVNMNKLRRQTQERVAEINHQHSREITEREDTITTMQQSSDYEEELRREQARCFELGMTLQDALDSHSRSRDDLINRNEHLLTLLEEEKQISHMYSVKLSEYQTREYVANSRTRFATEGTMDRQPVGRQHLNTLREPENEDENDNTPGNMFIQDTKNTDENDVAPGNMLIQDTQNEQHDCGNPGNMVLEELQDIEDCDSLPGNILVE